MIINWNWYKKWSKTPRGPKGMCMRCKKWKIVFVAEDQKYYCIDCKPVRWVF